MIGASVGLHGIRIGIDIGGTKSHAIALDENDAVRCELVGPSGIGVSGLLNSITRLVSELARNSGVEQEEIASIGIGVPGQVDVTSGTVRHVLNLNVEEWQLADAVHEAVGLRPAVENDVNVAALGARRVLDISDSMAYLNLGTGVAAGIILGDGLLRGAGGAAGEIGHVSIDPNGPVCDCGQRGCIEAFAGGRSLARTVGSSRHPMTTVLNAAEHGDLEALGVLEGFTRSVAAAVRLLVLAVDVKHVVIGGGVLALGDRVTNPILSAIELTAEDSSFIRSLGLSSRVSFVAAAHKAPTIGAALLGAGAWTGAKSSVG